MVKKILLALLVLLIVIQFFRPEKNQSTAATPNAIGNKYEVPANVANIFKTSCNDCHSNYTEYPWYNNIQPVAWWLNDHIEDGKRHLNFDEFLSYPVKKQDHKLEEVVEMVESKEMPLESYTWIHREADITPEQRELIINWAKDVRKKINYQPGTDQLSDPH